MSDLRRAIQGCARRSRNRYPQTSNWSAVNAAGRSMAAMGNSFSNTSWSIVRGAERSARAGAKSIGLCRKDRHEGASWSMSRGCHTGPAICPHCSLSHDSFLSSTSASLVRGSFRFRPFSPLRLADAAVFPGMSGNLRPRLASSSSSSPLPYWSPCQRVGIRSGGRGDVRNCATAFPNTYLSPDGPTPRRDFLFCRCRVVRARSARDASPRGGARISPANARKVFRAQRSQGRIYDVRSAWVVTIPPSDSTWSRWSPSGTLFRGSFFLGLSQKLTSTPRPLLRSGAPFLLAPCRARCRRDTPLAFHSISEERLVRQARYTVACKHRRSRGLQVDG